MQMNTRTENNYSHRTDHHNNNRHADHNDGRAYDNSGRAHLAGGARSPRACRFHPTSGDC